MNLQNTETMTTDNTNKDRQNVGAGKHFTESNPPDAGFNNQKGGDPYGSMYQCPAKCEGSKTYEQPLNCPVCTEKLVIVV
ncbi:MAG: hypothetical protein CVT94_14380 [Bacteroidetes bacterium HGW-Bacteroidetes-11]|jgi:hypothetical protein|nr:MAG: hypothetical protein CVT94_14380 [Bacteroidetes bacterium HGW-Bacteroidetes-11]